MTVLLTFSQLLAEFFPPSCKTRFPTLSISAIWQGMTHTALHPVLFSASSWPDGLGQAGLRKLTGRGGKTSLHPTENRGFRSRGEFFKKPLSVSRPRAVRSRQRLTGAACVVEFAE